MLMPNGGGDFNGCSDVLQYKLIQAAKERNKNDNNTFNRRLENVTHMDEEELDVKYDKKNLKKKQGLDNDGEFCFHNRDDRKRSNFEQSRTSQEEYDYVPSVKIASHHPKKRAESLPVSKNRRLSKSVKHAKEKHFASDAL